MGQFVNMRFGWDNYNIYLCIIGIMVAGVFAAAMSSLNSILHSATATFVKDVYEPYLAKGKQAALKQSMLFICGISVAAVILIYVYLSGSGNSIMQSIAGMSAPHTGHFDRRRDDAAVHALCQ